MQIVIGIDRVRECRDLRATRIAADNVGQGATE
jgi:hypothetical protein